MKPVYGETTADGRVVCVRSHGEFLKTFIHREMTMEVYDPGSWGKKATKTVEKKVNVARLWIKHWDKRRVAQGVAMVVGVRAR